MKTPARTRSSAAERAAAALPSAAEVAAFLCELASEEREPEEIDQFRAQKLLYFTQAWSLARRGRPMFSESVEAWKNGPVVYVVYRLLKKFGETGIVPRRPSNLSEEDKDFIASVWQDYKELSNIGLWRLTHEEGPWVDARKGIPKGARSGREITAKSMREYFAAKLPSLTAEDQEEFLAVE